VPWRPCLHDLSSIGAGQVRSRHQILAINAPATAVRGRGGRHTTPAPAITTPTVDHRNPVTAFHHAGGEPEDALNDQVRS
jgi:hypothetical protein